MRYTLLAALVFFLAPTSLLAAAPATFSAGQSLVAASSSLGNSYVAGASVVLTAPVAGDFSAYGGSVVTAAPVAGDDFLLAGSVNSRAPVAGDLRTLGGNIDIAQPVGGDLIAVGLSVRDTGRAGGTVFIVAANTVMTNGASGPVTLYGNNISLAGDFSGNVHVVAGGLLTLAPGTTVHGKLSYEAPEAAVIPASAVVSGGVAYTDTSYLPGFGTSRVFAFISVGFFIIARIIGALILAGLLAGLFPRFAGEITRRSFENHPRDILLALLLGFAIFVATPLVIVLLTLTFVGLGLALLLLILYALLALLALLYAGILAGGMFSRRILARERILWHDGVVGMAIISLISLVPFVGLISVAFITCFVAGTLLQIFFRFAFTYSEETSEMF